jgi:hypothetical protein
MSQLLWDLPPRVGSLLLHCHLRRSNNLVDQQKRTNNLHGAFFSMSVFLCLMLSDCHGFLHGLLLSSSSFGFWFWSPLPRKVNLEVS